MERVHFYEMYVHCSNLCNIREIVCTLHICSYAPLRSIMIDCKPWYVHKLIDYAYTLLPNLEITILLFHFLPLRNVTTLTCSKHTLFGQRKSKFFTLVHVVVRDIYDFLFISLFCIVGIVFSILMFVIVCTTMTNHIFCSRSRRRWLTAKTISYTYSQLFDFSLAAPNVFQRQQ